MKLTITALAVVAIVSISASASARTQNRVEEWQVSGRTGYHAVRHFGMRSMGNMRNVRHRSRYGMHLRSLRHRRVLGGGGRNWR